MGYEINDFNNDVIEKSKSLPVLVDFWASWCGPCRVLGPVLERLAEKYKDKFTLAKVNTDENQEISVEYGIRGIPAVKLFANGNVVDEFVGAMPENMVEEWLKKAIPSKYKSSIESAKKLINTEKAKVAKEIIENVLKNEPNNEEAKLILGKLLIFEDRDRAKELIKNIDSSLESFEQAESIATLIELLDKYENNTLPEDDVRSKYASAIKHLKARNFDAALKDFIDVLKDNRQYDEDGARRACIAIFKYLGEENEITLKHRKEFNSSLYV
jgi:putative thioredoxin